MQPLIAIDVALLPPPAVSHAAIALSAALPRTESQGLTLDPEHLPHITVTQQFVRGADLPAIAETINRLLAGHHALPLRIGGPGRGDRSVWMQLERTPELSDLHRAVMDALLPFEQRGGQADAFAGGDARPRDVQWVSGFRGTSAYERYTPHITLGHARRLPHVKPTSFDAELVAVCRLGRFCTCREVVHLWSLAPTRGAGSAARTRRQAR